VALHFLPPLAADFMVNFSFRSGAEMNARKSLLRRRRAPVHRRETTFSASAPQLVQEQANGASILGA
jgi:hypothetical protein